MQHQPAEQEEEYDTGPENPLVLLGPPLDHPDRVAADPQRIRDAVQLLLCPLQHIPLVPQIAEHGAASLQVLVQLRVRLLEEALFAQGVGLACRLLGRSLRAEGEGG